MALTPNERTRRQRERLLETARQYSPKTYKNHFVAPIFQRMIRAEAAAEPAGMTPVVMEGKLVKAFRQVGQCACVTCATVGPWKGDNVGGGIIETGHYVPSRVNSIIFDEDNAHPQCVRCNQHLGGNQSSYRQWMLAICGEEVIRRLERLKDTTVSFTREELVDRRIAYQTRLNAAIDKMKAQEP